MRVVDLAADGASSGRHVPDRDGRSIRAGWGVVVPDAAAGGSSRWTRGLHLRDGATGELLATLAEGGGRASRRSSSRTDASSSAPRRAGEPGPRTRARRVFDRAGAELGETRLDLCRPGAWARARGRPRARRGVVLPAARSSPRTPWSWTSARAGSSSGSAGLRPAIGFWGARPRSPRAGLASVHFFRDVEGRRRSAIDFATGERKVVAGPGAPRGERISAR